MSGDGEETFSSSGERSSGSGSVGPVSDSEGQELLSGSLSDTLSVSSPSGSCSAAVSTKPLPSVPIPCTDSAF